MPLPQRIALPPAGNLVRLEPGFVLTQYYPFVRASAEALPGIEVRDDPGLAAVSWSTIQVRVDDTLVYVEMSDFSLPDPRFHGEDHWFLFHYISALEPYRRLAPFSPASFVDWRLYDRVAAEVFYAAESDIILNNQVLTEFQDARNERRRRLYRELRPVHDRVDVTRTPCEAWLRKAGDCLCYVHAPGSSTNMLDRNPVQMMAMGVCVIQPTIYTYLGSGPPVPGVHYLACRDDFSDVLELIHWCEGHRPKCRMIGAAAAALFREQATPVGIWSRVATRVHGS